MAARLIAADRAAGYRPFLLVGTADTGTIDPLLGVAELARREDLWLHIDGAYGGFFQLTRRGRERMIGIASADSITLDPHKGLDEKLDLAAHVHDELATVSGIHVPWRPELSTVVFRDVAGNKAIPASRPPAGCSCPAPRSAAST